jgi:hypothetical protein
LTKTDKNSIIIIEREKEVIKMRDREAFELKAIECGAIIIRSEKNVLTIESKDQRVMTTYLFTEDGKFRDFLTTWY